MCYLLVHFLHVSNFKYIFDLVTKMVAVSFCYW